MAVPPSNTAISAYMDMIATNYVGLASYTFLVYDHLLTFDEEVEYVWKGRKGPVIYLFFLNRYFFVFAFIFNLNANLNPNFTPHECHYFVRFEGACALISLGIAGLMMMLRVNALYGGKRFAVIFLAVLWLNTIGVFSWLLTGIMTVKHPDGIRGCALVLPFGPLATLSSTLPVVFDSAVLVLTLRPTYSLFRSRMGGHIVKILVEDGILYYLVISKCNLILTIMIATAPPGYRNIMGQITQLMTVTMMSRITIHLRAETRRKQSVVFSDSMNTNSHAPVQFVQAERATTSMQSVGTSSSWFALDARENANNAEDRRVSFLGEEAYEMWVLPTIRE